MSPADAPTPTNDPGTAPSGARDATGTVAVIDTGYSEVGESMQWLADRVEGVHSTFDQEDAATIPANIAGHGLFVSSVIVQEAPNTEVRVARLGRYDASLVPPGFENVFTTDELQLYIAISRLLRVPNMTYSALNLSFGSYACDNLGGAPEDNSGLAIREAVDLWTSRQGEAPIVAAAGNHQRTNREPLPPFLPAAYDTGPNDLIYSVMSTDELGNVSDFSNSGMCGAWGERLIGVGATDSWVYWSGSSFATALLTAKGMLNGGTPPCEGSSSPDIVATAPAATAPPTTTGSTGSGTDSTTTTRPPTSQTTTTLG
jgi:hypothetical protein